MGARAVKLVDMHGNCEGYVILDTTSGHVSQQIYSLESIRKYLKDMNRSASECDIIEELRDMDSIDGYLDFLR